ncbi:GAF domain-containing sensor histidine kinase [Spirosoma luteum]|uniref:GAF domain-containing sensor histidine kinase n=1 Tax=Spirosoma luteum TaxID=431553 RepID=UPI0003666C99|nr:PAS domain S-box protein [Spirosoma luteum]
MRTKNVFELLYEASKAITSEIELQNVVQKVTDIATELTDAQFGAFFYNVTNQSGESLVLYTISGVAKEAFSKFPMPRNTNIFEPTFTASGTVRYDDVTQQPHYGQNAPHQGMPRGHLPVRSYLAVPVVSPFTKEAIGGLFFGHPEPGIFTEDSEKLVEGIAVQAAIAITNARLFEEKRYNEDRLKEQREQYKSIFNAITDSAIIYDENGTIVEANPTACQLYGYTYEELIGLNASTFFKMPGDFQALKEIALSGREYAGVHERIGKDGRLISVEFKGLRFIFKDKPHVLSVSREATLQQQTREALQEGESLAHIITRNSPITLWMTDSEGQTNYINQTWVDWVGGTIKSQLEEGWARAVIPEDRGRMRESFDYAFQNRKAFVSEFRIRRKNGEVRWCLSNGSPYYNEDGKFSGYAGSVSDTTERKAAEQKLASQNTLINTITSNTQQALFLMNDRQVCTYMNPAAEQMTGFKMYEVQDKPLHYYIHHTHPDGSHFPIEDCPIDRALPTKAHTKGEGVFIHKNGRFYPVAFTASPIIDNGVPVGTVIEARDTTEEKRIEEALRNKEKHTLQMLEEKVKERTQALERTNFELQRFTSIASHDLKEPVRKISIFSKMLQDKLENNLDETSLRHLQKIIQSSDRMVLLIDGLLAISRLSNSELPVKDVDLNEVVHEVIENLEIPIKEQDARIELGNLPTVQGMAIQMEQVFQNLISNSLKFSHGQRTPHIRITGEDGLLNGKEAVTIFYSDNGIGFRSDQSEKIFDIFYRLHTKEQTEGTGIGLSIVKKIIDSHHGTIRAEGKEGEGAYFEIKLPK